MGGFLGVAGMGGRSGTSERAEIMPHSHALATVEGEAGGGRQRPRPFVTFATLAIGLIATAMDNREAEGATQSTNCPGARCSPRFHRPGARTFFRDTCSARRAPPVRNYSRFLATKPRSGTKAILLRSKRSLAHGKSPGRQIRQSRYASKTSPLRARTRFRGQKVGPSLSNQDCYRPDRPRRARTAQTPLKPPLRQAGPFGAPDRRGPARN